MTNRRAHEGRQTCGRQPPGREDHPIACNCGQGGGALRGQHMPSRERHQQWFAVNNLRPECRFAVRYNRTGDEDHVHTAVCDGRCVAARRVLEQVECRVVFSRTTRLRPRDP